MRERIEDLEQLANVILDHIAVRAGARRRELDRSALEVLATHDWPGNVRELQNILERACMLTDRIDLTAGDFATSLPPSALARDGKPRGSRQVRPLAQAIAELERASIRAALEASGGKKTAAARLLGISRSSFYQKVAEYGLESYPHS
jgi:DNA-binding NtrC family response regulator